MPRKYRRTTKDIFDLDPPWVKIADLGLMEQQQKLKHPVVLVNGCFDIFHSGHAKILYHARKKAKTLIVAMDSDKMVAAAKPNRPIQSWIERAVMFRYFNIDYLVEINSDRDFVDLVEKVRPDLRVKGAEYVWNNSRVPSIPILYVHDSGMRTSKIVERILKKYAPSTS